MIDTAQKRASLISMGRVWTPFLPAPDGAISTAGDRQQLAWVYAGSVAAPITDDFITVTLGDAADIRSSLSDQTDNRITLTAGTDSVTPSDTADIRAETNDAVSISILLG